MGKKDYKPYPVSSINLRVAIYQFILNSCCCCVASVVSDSVRPRRRQPTKAPPSLEFSRQEHWSGLPFPSPMHENEKWKWSRSVAQSCPTLSDPMDYSLPGSSVHGIFQARVLEWGAIAFSVNRVTLLLCDLYLNKKQIYLFYFIFVVVVVVYFFLILFYF